MKRVTLYPSYRAAVQWIARNDESAERDAEVIAGLPSLLLVSDLFGTDPAVVAQDVLRVRNRDDAQDRTRAVAARMRSIDND